MSMKFALRTMTGEVDSYWLCERRTYNPGSAAGKAKKPPTHHILVIDRSGSMYYDIADLKTMVEKILTMSEFNDPSLRVSLISYSGMGDVKLHFSKVTVEDVLRADSPYVKEIRSIRSTGATCISQAVTLANSIIDTNDITAISLHSDGYANDRSPASEMKEIEKGIAAITAKSNVFVNTVAYGNYCDYSMLARIANQGSGSCVQAKSIKEVYSAIHDTTKSLAGDIAKPFMIEGFENGIVLFVSASAKKILGTQNGNLTVRGVSDSDDKVAYLLVPVTKEVYEKDSSVDGQGASEALYAFARYLLSIGELNLAKYALVSTQNTAMLKKHAKALVSAQLAEFAADLEDAVFNGIPVCTGGYGIPVTASVLDVLTACSKYPAGLMIHMPTLSQTYTRRGVVRIAGVRNQDGTVDKPAFFTKSDTLDWSAPASFSINNTEPTINAMFVAPATLVNALTNEEVAQVAGATLNLKQYRNYTIVSDGVVNVNSLRVKVVNKQLHNELVALGVVSGAFDHNKEHDLNLSELPVVGYGSNNLKLRTGVFKELCQAKVWASITDALATAATASGAGDQWSKEQIEELKRHYLTPAMYFSAPTTTHYSDLDKAVAEGHVDYRTSFQCHLGSREIMTLGDIPSANAFLQRRFVMKVNGKEEKATLSKYYSPDVTWEIKPLTGRTKLTAVDDLMYPVFLGVLGLSDPKVKSKSVSSDLDLSNIAATNKTANATLDALYAEVRPLLFYIGSTGMVPSSLKLTMMTPEDFATYSGLKPGKDEAEGTFFVNKATGESIIVYMTSKPFTTRHAKVVHDDAA